MTIVVASYGRNLRLAKAIMMVTVLHVRAVVIVYELAHGHLGFKVTLCYHGQLIEVNELLFLLRFSFFLVLCHHTDKLITQDAV